MSWFDKLFGDDNPSDQTSAKNKRSTITEKQNHSLIPQTNDVYQRPRGKFRFPISMGEQLSERTENVEPSNHSHVQKTERTAQQAYSIDRKSRRHRTQRHATTSQTQHEDSSRRSQFHTSNRSDVNRYPNHVSNRSWNNPKAREHQPTSSPSTSRRTSQKQQQTNTYLAHHQEFKASEVPSAIFGTQNRKPIQKSGLNQPPGTRSEASQSKMETATTKKSIPTHSKRDNTVNIENICASQIVDEIRREREKKMLQKKRFKQALQQKREAHQTDANADMQKAIDEMHASQARQLLGEQYAASENDEQQEDAVPNDCVDMNAQESHDSQDSLSIQEMEYEEIDLDQITSSTNKADATSATSTNENVAVNEAIEHVSENVSDSEEALNSAWETNREVEDNSNGTELTEVTQEQPQHSDMGTDGKISKNVNQNDNTSNEDEIDYTDVDQNDNRETHDTKFNVQRETYDDSHSDIQSHQEEPLEETTSTTVDEPQLTPAINERQNQKLNAQADLNNADVKQSNQEEPPLKPEIKPQPKTREPKTPIRKGSKPFNVVMTPSDKKRMLNREKLNKAHVQHSDKNVSVSKNNNNVDRAAQSQLQIEQQKSSEHVESPELVAASTVSTENGEETKKIRRGPILNLPSIDLLDQPEIQERDNAWIEEKKQQLNDAFYYFNVPAEVVNVIEGPSVTRFELSVERGVKVSRITALQDDIKMALAAKDIRIEAPIPGTSLVGIEVPNQHPTKVNLRSILETQAFKHAESKLTVAMGSRINNEPLLMDIAKTPHALIAGATGSGKSVSINSILLSLLYRNHPEELKLLLIDPKMVELAPYNDLPHLVAPVITDVKAATQSLKWAVEEMERRYKRFAQTHVRNITAFNKKVSYDQRMPKIVIVIDELSDLMMMAPQDVEQSIARIAQKARACGIHMLVATQRPSVNVITGLIKANIPTRIAFMVSSSVDSRTILDSGGAERLLGYGDMLYLGGGMNKPIRVQGTFVSDEEIDEVVEYIKSQREPEYLFQEKELLKKTEESPKDELFNEVCEFMIKEGNISTSLIQRHFQIGYNRAARIIDQLEQLGYISGSNGSKPRDVFLTEADLQDS
ncbi:DNA translocase FtsK [Staphylococcus ratti]|uniref:DNA translocase FtsK n=1 Tax=Staphylococcus ratti TaxID=2892440 RepID=A0ABY3PF71_9STAP|nr:DNA translocase FtsK [Staphylococcus ratti]UEX90940.1 DNA translocase FtsK [Staphylococcus ratti]